MMILRGLSDFATDYKDFFKLQVKRLSRNVHQLTDDNKKLLLNMCRALHHDISFEPLKDSISQYLLSNVDNYENEYLISVIPYLSRGSKSNSSRALVCQTLIKLFNDESKLQLCTVEQLSNILESVSWWKIRILSLLSTRINEVRNAKNLGLFVDIYNSINAMTWFHHPFMLSSSQFVKDPHLMSRISPLQFTRILQTFNKIRYYDKESYESMLEYISSDFNGLSNRMNQLSDVLLAAADANIQSPNFYKKCSSYIYEYFNVHLKIPNDNFLSYLESQRIWPRDLANLSWSLTVLGYHKTPEFIPLIQLLLSPEIVSKLTTFEVEMVLHCSEACIIECTNIPKLMLIAQDISHVYNKQLSQIKSDHEVMLSEDTNNTTRIYNHNDKPNAPWISRHQSLYSEFHQRGRIRASRQIQNTLKHMGIDDVLSRVTPHFSSPNIIDICFSKENKKGIVILGGNFLMRDSTTGDWNYTETGLTILQRRILTLQNWKIYEIGCSYWAQMTNLQDRKDLLRKALNYLEIEIPDL